MQQALMASVAAQGSLIAFSVLGCRVRIECDPVGLRVPIQAAFGAFRPCPGSQDFDLDYRVIQDRATGNCRLIRDDEVSVRGGELGEILFSIQQDLVVTVQRLRSDLFFLHSAVIDRGGRAVLFTAESGSGKSTLCWGLLHRGFRYMSDELAPIDLKSLQVLPFPIAVTLKAIPAVPFSPPALALKTRRALYVPVDRLPEAPVIDPTPIQAILFVSYSPAAPEPEVRELSAAEATARLYPNVLNALAHESMGLDQAIRLTGALPCYHLVSAGLEETTEMVSELMASF